MGDGKHDLIAFHPVQRSPDISHIAAKLDQGSAIANRLHGDSFHLIKPGIERSNGNPHTDNRQR